MAKKTEIDCENCNQKEHQCCKNCLTDLKFNVFSPLSENELHFLEEDKKTIRYNVGETIIKQNTSSTTVICINEGLAKVYIESNNGKNVILKIAQKGDFITGGGLFNGSVQHFSVAAITPVKCCLIDSAKLISLFSGNSDFAIGLLRHNTKQNNYLLAKLVNHTQKYMPGRVADTLLYLKNEIFKSESFTVPLSRSELAEMSNMTKESFVRILHQFKESELINTQGNTIYFLNDSSLKEISING